MKDKETAEMGSRCEDIGMMAVVNATADAGKGIPAEGNSESEGEQPDLPLPPEKQEEFDQCCEVLERHKRSVPEVAKAIAIIDREGYCAYYEGGKFKNVTDFAHEIYGLERTYIYRMKKFGYWLLEDDIPEGYEPSETAMREVLQTDVSAEDRKKIYRDAQEICLQRRKKAAKKPSAKSEEKSESDSESSGDSTSGDNAGECVTVDPEESVQVVPEAKDIREAFKNFKEASGRIYFSLLDNKSYSKDTTFQQILEENADKIESIRTVLDCFRHYKAATNMTLVPPETAQAVRNRIAALISEAEKEMEELLRDSSPASAPDTI